MSQHLLTSTTESTYKNEAPIIALFDPSLVFPLHTPKVLKHITSQFPQNIKRQITAMAVKIATEQLENALAEQERNHTLAYMPRNTTYQANEPLSLRLYLNEDIPTDTLSNCIENDKIETLFITSSGQIALSGVHSFFPLSYCDIVDTSATHVSLTTATISPGNYHLTVYPATYTPQHYSNTATAFLGKTNLHLIHKHNRLLTSGSALIALGIALTISSLFIPGSPLRLIAFTSIAIGFVTRYRAKQFNKQHHISNMQSRMHGMYLKIFPHFIATMKQIEP